VGAMKVLSPEQELLAEYLAAVGIPAISRILIIDDLWEPEATMEMLEYIAETKEQNIEKLESVACEISRKWRKSESLLNSSEEQNPEMERKWNKMWMLWMNDKLESPYQEILTYENEVRNGSHLHYFNWIQEHEDFEKIIDVVSLNLKGTVLEPIFNKAYAAYQELDQNEETANQILQFCDDAFAEAADDIENFLETIASKIQL
jgi:hypothetical protein